MMISHIMIRIPAHEKPFNGNVNKAMKHFVHQNQIVFGPAQFEGLQTNFFINKTNTVSTLMKIIASIDFASEDTLDPLNSINIGNPQRREYRRTVLKNRSDEYFICQ